MTTGSTLEISVTEKAAVKVRQFAVKEGKDNNFALRVGVKGGRVLWPAVHPQHRGRHPKRQ